MLNAATPFHCNYKTSPDFLINMRVSRSRLNLHSWVNLSFKLWKLPTRLPKHLLNHPRSSCIQTLHQEQSGYGFKEAEASCWQFSNQTTGQTLQHNTEKSTRLSRTCTNTHPLIISAHNTRVFSKREQRDIESVCIISTLLRRFSVPGSV